jgi:hypothetical protein
MRGGGISKRAAAPRWVGRAPARALACALAALLVTAAAGPAARAQPLAPRVLVLPVEGQGPAGLGDLVFELTEALARGAALLTPTVARATAPLEDTAVIVGCDPAVSSCLDQVAAALNVDQLLIARITAAGADATVEVTAITREAEPVRESFRIRRKQRGDDLAAIEKAVPRLLEAGEARRRDAAGGRPPPEPPPEPLPEPPPGPPPPPAPSRIGPLLVAGAGVALVTTGGVFWGLAAASQRDIDAAPTETPGDLERLATLEERARGRALIGNVAVAAGAAVLGAGVTWYVLQRGPSGREVRTAPLLLPGGGGLAVQGAW